VQQASRQACKQACLALLPAYLCPSASAVDNLQHRSQLLVLACDHLAVI
jgi:hypothetical protein